MTMAYEKSASLRRASTFVAWLRLQSNRSVPSGGNGFAAFQRRIDGLIDRPVPVGSCAAGRGHAKRMARDAIITGDIDLGRRPLEDFAIGLNLNRQFTAEEQLYAARSANGRPEDRKIAGGI